MAHPRPAARAVRLLTPASVRWVLSHRAWTPGYLVRYWRLFRLRIAHPDVVTEGLAFLGRGVEAYARPGYGRLILGRWVHVGDHSSIRCHEGSLRIGDKCVLGKYVTIDGYLDVEIGAATIVADGVYVCDFDHRFDELTKPIKDQGIVKSPVRIGPDVWIGTKATVLRGVTIGRGSVIAAHCLVDRDIPPYSVAVGVPARVVANRLERATMSLDADPPVAGVPRGAAQLDPTDRAPVGEPAGRIADRAASS